MSSCYILIGQLSEVTVHTKFNRFTLSSNLLKPLPSNLKVIPQCRIHQRNCTRSRDSTRHVANTVMDNPFLDIDRIVMGNYMVALATTTLVDCHINKNRTVFHLREILSADPPEIEWSCQSYSADTI